MKALVTLKKEAAKAARWRGHRLRWRMEKSLAFGQCIRCGATVYVDPAPPANGIDISGKAVALGCPI